MSHNLLNKSLHHRYLVRSRGSLASSLLPTLTHITQLNPLPPHYLSPTCNHSQFFNHPSLGSRFHLPHKHSPQCHTPYKKHPHHIPFQTFLPFKPDKLPHIHFNFSPQYHPIPHNYTKQ
ncbi:hypothetical protein, partial [Bacillus pumilus]|uniref:hypothetical protein n=1 Tax=Bacillus pumilus TaxID=1408 RepID=UPI003F68B818